MVTNQVQRLASYDEVARACGLRACGLWSDCGQQEPLHLCSQAESASIMSKWGKYKKLYRKEWETDPELKTWIASVPEDSSKAGCKYCNTDIRAQNITI